MREACLVFFAYAPYRSRSRVSVPERWQESCQTHMPRRIPVVVAISVLIYLHRRNIKRQRQEDLNDPHKSLDFGLENGAGKGSRRSLLGREKDTPSRLNRQQMSMDMNMSSPYLLPPEVHNSRESLNSLAKSLKQSEDPYRTAVQYATSDAGSIRSMQRGHEAQRTPSRQDSPPKSPILPPEPSHLKPQSPLPGEGPSKGPLSPLETTFPSLRRQDDESVATGAPVEEATVVHKSVPRLQPSPTDPSPADSGVAVEYATISNPFEKPEAQEMETPSEGSTVGIESSDHQEPARASVGTSVSSSDSRSTSPARQSGQPAAPSAPVIEEPRDNDSDRAEMPQHPPSLSPGNGNNRVSSNGKLDVEEPRGRNMQRMSHLYDKQNGAQGGLAVPQQDNRRLSVGFRPLPPGDIMESEDPEYRANRIRSFYKEYFDESKPEDRPPVPPVPPMAQQQQQQQPQQQQHQQQKGTDYYEDFDASYAEDAPYFDPATNSFVMPYAQPVSRRAMTPPPSSRQRFPGPRGPPRAFHGSQSSVRLPLNVRGPPRPGSSVSNQMGPPSRPGSSASGGPRSASAMSRRPMPPPADLTTLPTPSKLKDDSLAILNAIDFAPPESISERARGRSQSPAGGERRPYRLNVPVHSPLASAFEELPTLPSPYVLPPPPHPLRFSRVRKVANIVGNRHLLRKSGTYTALDFAPPRKFTESEGPGETGSIRSNRSGLSAAQVHAIRSGAGRVSKLPGDQVFTQADLSKTLKPQWGMRD